MKVGSFFLPCYLTTSRYVAFRLLHSTVTANTIYQFELLQEKKYLIKPQEKQIDSKENPHGVVVRQNLIDNPRVISFKGRFSGLNIGVIMQLP